MEIEKLHKMLTDAGIEHDWINRNRDIFREMDDVREEFGIDWGWQVIVRNSDGDYLISAIEGYGTYGYRCYKGELLSDLIEIMDCTTPEEEVTGGLTAEEVFGRIKGVICSLK